MKNYKKFLISGLSIMLGSSVFITSASATTVGTDIKSGIDYSKQGTIIEKKY